MTETKLAPDEQALLAAFRRDPATVAAIVCAVVTADEEQLAKLQAMKQEGNRAGLLAYARQLAARGKEAAS